MVRLKVYFSGTGPFEFALNLNKVEIPAEHPNIKMVEFDDHVLITILGMSAADAGRYELTVSNDSGQATCHFNLGITGLPGPPIGPLVISEVDKDQAALAWKPPQEDGGSKILHYVVEKRDTSRDEWTQVASYVKVMAGAM